MKHAGISRLVAAAVLLAAFSKSSAAVAQDYDLAILNGRVMDPETGLDAIRNVGVKAGKIVAVSEEAITADESIDATGHVVAPGFIDTHVHVVDHPFAQKLMLRDGVATPLDLEVGA